MVAPALSHLICSSALIVLILIMPFFFANIITNVKTNMEQRELKEVADYVSNTLANLYFLVNSTNSPNVSMEKEMISLPVAIEDSVFFVKIEASGANVSKITTYLKSNPAIAAEAWIGPGLLVGTQNLVESSKRPIIAGCGRSTAGVSVWIR